MKKVILLLTLTLNFSGNILLVDGHNIQSSQNIVIINPTDNFDSVVSSHQNEKNVLFVVKAGTHHVDTTHTWSVQDGWEFAGDGEEGTVIQLTGKSFGWNNSVFTTGNSNTFNAKFHDFTVDCNWGELGNSAPDGMTVRTFTLQWGTSNSSAIPNTATVLDIGRCIKGNGIPVNSWIGKVDTGNIYLSSSPVDNIPVNASIPPNTVITIFEKDCKLGAMDFYGANGFRINNIHAIHAFGSGANGQEAFVIGLWASADKDGEDNLVTNCLVDNCFGNYGNPYLAAGYRPGGQPCLHTMNNTKFFNCSAVGKQGIVGYSIPGSCSPFTGGGVNFADVKNLTVENCSFTDCALIAYIDTGGYDTVNIINNTLIRGWQGAASVVGEGNFPDAHWNNFTVIGNNIGIQRRVWGGANYCVIVRNDSNPVIKNNTITYDITGPGNDVFWGMGVSGTKGTITGNIISGSEYAGVGDNGVVNGPADIRYMVYGNRDSNGGMIPGLADNRPAPPTNLRVN